MSRSAALRENLANRDVCTEGLPDQIGKEPAKESRARRFAGVQRGGHGGAGADGSIRSGGRPRGVSRLQSSAMEKTRAQPLLEGGTPAGRCGGAAQYQAVQVLISNESCTSQDDSWDGAPGEAWAEFHRVN